RRSSAGALWSRRSSCAPASGGDAPGHVFVRFSSKKCRVSSVLTHHVSRFTSYASLYRLAFLAHDPLIGVAHTLALVRFGRVKAAEFSSHLSHNLPVWAFNGEL